MSFKYNLFPFSTNNLSISNTMIRSFQNCRRYFFLSYIMKLVPVKIQKAFIFGTYFGKGLDLFYSKGKVDIDNIMELYFKELETFSNHLTPEEIEVYNTQAFILEGLLTGYENFYKQDKVKYNYITHEPSFKFSIGTIDKCEVTYNGRIDLLLKNKKSKEVVLMEHKTAALQSMDNNYITKLALDTQVTGYILGSESLGHNVKEIIYNINGKSALRKKNAESDNDFKNRVIDDYIQNGTKYFKREILRRTSAELKIFLEELKEKAKDILFCLEVLPNFTEKDLKYFYKCESNCVGPYGACQYLSICKGKNNFDDYSIQKDFTVKERTY